MEQRYGTYYLAMGYWVVVVGGGFSPRSKSFIILCISKCNGPICSVENSAALRGCPSEWTAVGGGGLLLPGSLMKYCMY